MGSMEDSVPKAAALAIKRVLDVIIGLAGTAAFLITFPLLAFIIKLETPGPAIYRQDRVGKDRRDRKDRRAGGSFPALADRRQSDERRSTDLSGRVFTIYKFRTMDVDGERNGPRLCGKGCDPRVTRFGSWLRAQHLDELPQFWNVLKGDMSFIGPRPERPHFTVRYRKDIPSYHARTSHVKPGITG